MASQTLSTENTETTAVPLCPVFGTCGGCAYQDRSYESELALKSAQLTDLFSAELGADRAVFEPVFPSPEPYHYRNRIDLTLRRFKTGEFALGFQLAGSKRLLPVESCAIARKEISDRIPRIFNEAKAKLPEDYRIANLTIRTGDTGKVRWGGIGRRSLQMEPKDYFWTKIRGRRIYYALDTFFQANLSILPGLIDKIETVSGLGKETVFFDLYAGVGLFGIALADKVKKVIAIEESSTSVALMRYNRRQHKLDHFEAIQDKVENTLHDQLALYADQPKVAIIDPPRRGLSRQVCETVSQAKSLDSLLYLSCSPASLVRDLQHFLKAGWKLEKVMPFDFFPKTEHLETLVLLKP